MMEKRYEREIKRQIRFEWGERMAPDGKTKRMNKNDKFALDILDYVLDEHPDRKLVSEMDKAIRQGYNQACEDYDTWLYNLGPKY